MAGRRFVEGPGASWGWDPRGPGTRSPTDTKGPLGLWGSQKLHVGLRPSGGKGHPAPLLAPTVGVFPSAASVAAPPVPRLSFCDVVFCPFFRLQKDYVCFLTLLFKSAFWIRVSFSPFVPRSVSFAHSVLASLGGSVLPLGGENVAPVCNGALRSGTGCRAGAVLLGGRSRRNRGSS